MLRRTFVDLHREIHRPIVRWMKTEASTSSSSTLANPVKKREIMREIRKRTWVASPRFPSAERYETYKAHQKAEKEEKLSEEQLQARKELQKHIRHRETLKQRFPEGWNPPRKISREAMDGLRALHTHDPTAFTTPVLAEKFRICPEAVRKILRSKWVPKKEEKAKLLMRDRRRKQEYIEQRIEREKLSTVKERFATKERSHEEDGFSLV